MQCVLLAMAAELTYIAGCRGLAETLRMVMTVGDIEVSNGRSCTIYRREK